MSSQDVTVWLLIATLSVSLYGLLNNEKYAKDPWHIPFLVSILLVARKA